MFAALAALGLACNNGPARAVYGGPPPEPPPERTRMYFHGDPTATLERMRKNAAASGCPIDEKTSGTLFSCGDVEVWAVPDANGVEITCRGIPSNCSTRTRGLLSDVGDAGSD